MGLDLNSQGEQKPCRTCVDFKTWAKQRSGVKHEKLGVKKKFAILIIQHYAILIIQKLFFFFSIIRIAKVHRRRYQMKQAIEIGSSMAVHWTKMNWDDQHGICYIQWQRHILTIPAMNKNKM